MIPVSEALAQLFALMTPTPTEHVGLAEARGRVLAVPVTARRDQPPFAASAMDGYAVPEGAVPGAVFTVIGEARAGERFAGRVGPGQAARIFTGAPIPEGAVRVVIQEDVTRDGDRITLSDGLDAGPHIRPAGGDFRTGEVFMAPRRLGPGEIALLAAMNCPEVTVHRRPEVALIATGDELVQPGETPGPDQIVASNSYGLKALVEDAGCIARLLPIARDTMESLDTVLGLAEGADLIVTIGGASVGDHDLVAKALAARGADMAFHKVAMRPGKPLMAGKLPEGVLGGAALIGLPGNPVSALVCGHVFLRPALDALHGLPPRPAARGRAILGEPIAANGPREHYLRARTGADGRVAAATRQDSALLSVLADADCLIVRPPHAPAAAPGETVETLAL